MDIHLSNHDWTFAAKNKKAIESYWASRRAQQPLLFNGKVLLLRDWKIEHGQLTGNCLTTDYASFLYWREHGAPDRSVVDFSAAGAIHSHEGWLILGRASEAMSNAGKIYPPCGSFDAVDGRDRIDIDDAIVREIGEETGLIVDPARFGPTLAVNCGTQLVIMRAIQMVHPCNVLVAEIDEHLKSEPHPEISEIVVVKNRDNIDMRDMPAFTIAYIEHAFPAKPDRGST